MKIKPISSVEMGKLNTEKQAVPDTKTDSKFEVIFKKELRKQCVPITKRRKYNERNKGFKEKQ